VKTCKNYHEREQIASFVRKIATFLRGRGYLDPPDASKQSGQAVSRKKSRNQKLGQTLRPFQKIFAERGQQRFDVGQERCYNTGTTTQKTQGTQCERKKRKRERNERRKLKKHKLRFLRH